MMSFGRELEPRDLMPSVERLFSLSAGKMRTLQSVWDPAQGAPVFTVRGRYTSRGWTEWTQGFLFGSAVLQFDAEGDEAMLEWGRSGAVEHMTGHLSHIGVHDHGFNTISTFGNLLRLMKEGRVPAEDWQRRFYELAVKVSGAVQASRWTPLPDDLGFIYSFNGPHSLFIDTFRSLRILGAAHVLGHVLMSEQDERVSLLQRCLQHALTSIRYNVYFGEGRDAYDVRGRTVHEAIFNTNNGSFRCPGTQQGYSPFSTWTRGLAWALCGLSEQLEYLGDLPETEFAAIRAGGIEGKEMYLRRFLEAARAAADFYIETSPADGIPYWDTGAPGLSRMDGFESRPADPYNDYEPVDSSAAVIAAQGLLRLGRFLGSLGEIEPGKRYVQAGLLVADTLFKQPYLSTDPHHQGLILHSVYHRPNGWDYSPDDRKVPCGESSMWGDYHARELALYIRRLADGGPYYDFYTYLISRDP